LETFDKVIKINLLWCSPRKKEVVEMDYNIGALQAYIKAKDFHPELADKYFLKLAEEVGELARAMRKNLRPTEPSQIKETIEEELWDVIYYAFAIANVYGIDLEDVIDKKEAINREKYRNEDST
jgi:NTP pyrophosphatase (non-canonical NTP hydrolase)